MQVKRRLVEFLAVRRLKPDLKGPILCFLGPPGVGKTSLGRSIAAALERRFYRLALGGVHDEADIRGHRRTYVGAMPGRIIQALKRVGVNNPVLLLDEIDKLGRDIRGDPAAALLEVLDPEQNSTFTDHYLNVPFDLSHVLFITTANRTSSIPAALLDRMEVVELNGYTPEEKEQIAARYLLPKQLARHGLADHDVVLKPSVLCAIIQQYTREAGVRQLERELAALCRHRAVKVASLRTAKDEPTVPAAQLAAWTVTPEELERVLGLPKHEDETSARLSTPGVATGLVWTMHGGQIAFIEATQLSGGRGRLVLTGHLGEVIKESARIALSACALAGCSALPGAAARLSGAARGRQTGCGATRTSAT